MGITTYRADGVGDAIVGQRGGSRAVGGEGGHNGGGVDDPGPVGVSSRSTSHKGGDGGERETHADGMD